MSDESLEETYKLTAKGRKSKEKLLVEDGAKSKSKHVKSKDYSKKKSFQKQNVGNLLKMMATKGKSKGVYFPGGKDSKFLAATMKAVVAKKMINTKKAAGKTLAIAKTVRKGKGSKKSKQFDARKMPKAKEKANPLDSGGSMSNTKLGNQRSRFDSAAISSTLSEAESALSKSKEQFAIVFPPSADPMGKSKMILITSNDGREMMDMLKMLMGKMEAAGAKSSIVNAATTQEKSCSKEEKTTTAEAKTIKSPEGKTAAEPTPTTTTTTTATSGALSAADKERLEGLHDEFTDLLTNSKTIRDSYDAIIDSLVNLQGRTARRRKSKSSLAPKTPPGGESQQPQRLPELEEYLNSNSRDDAFRILFERIDKIKEKMDAFHKCFDNEGYLIEARYQEAPLSEDTIKAWGDELKEVSKVVGLILEQYNKDMLDMFRLNAGSSTGEDGEAGASTS